MFTQSAIGVFCVLRYLDSGIIDDCDFVFNLEIIFKFEFAKDDGLYFSEYLIVKGSL